MSTRAKAAAAFASLSVLGISWGAATAHGQTLALNPTYDTTTTSTTSTVTPVTTDTSTTTGTSTTDTSTAPTTTGTSTSDTSTTGDTSASSDSGSTSTSSPASTGTYTDGTYTGTTASHRYGSVTVTVTISGGVISDVSEQVVSDGERRSDQINTRAVPVVRSEVLAANSADVSTVSGATYTTRAYLSSLQSALDQASA